MAPSSHLRDMEDNQWLDPQLEVLCTLPEGPIRVLYSRGNVLYAETDAAIYQILQNGSFVGVRKEP